MSEIYNRQIALFDEEKQGDLEESFVLILGCGGLGCMTANQLSRAGVNLRLVDGDVVEESNLHRTLFRKRDIGRPKPEALGEILRESVEAEIESVTGEFDKDTWMDLISDVDIIVDCLDSMLPRYLLNEVSIKEGIPFVHGTVVKGEGRVKFFDAKGGCLRCLYGERPDPNLLQDCEEVGVLNSAVSAISSLQSNMVIKYLTGFGKINRDLLVLDMENGSFDSVEVHKKKNCDVCQKEEFRILEEKGI